MANTETPYEGVEIYDEIFEVTFTFGKQVAEVDGEPIYETFADGKPWHARFSKPLIEAMLK